MRTGASAGLTAVMIVGGVWAAVARSPRPAVAAPPTTAPAAVTLKPALQPVAFLVGDWVSDWGGGHGEGGMTLAGTSAMHAEVDGAVLVRRDHTVMTAADGKPAGAFDQLMTTYAEGGTLHADYFDGDHTLHYTSATVDPGKSVVFTTAATAGQPTFRLTYAAIPAGLSITFEMAPPGQTAYRVVVKGSLRRKP